MASTQQFGSVKRADPSLEMAQFPQQQMTGTAAEKTHEGADEAVGQQLRELLGDENTAETATVPKRATLMRFDSDDFSVSGCTSMMNARLQPRHADVMDRRMELAERADANVSGWVAEHKRNKAAAAARLALSTSALVAAPESKTAESAVPMAADAMAAPAKTQGVLAKARKFMSAGATWTVQKIFEVGAKQIQEQHW